MQLWERFWTTLTRFLSVSSLSPLHDDGVPQVPLLVSEPGPQPEAVSPQHVSALEKGPSFLPPGGELGLGFKCEYPEMKGYRYCSTSADRSCWLVNDEGDRYDIHSDYEKKWPQGIVRKYTLNVAEGKKPLNLDGLPFNESKLFNDEYPGPWLQACWGDRLEITVNNKMVFNGTSIHWHGIRQYRTMHMDGVNGITQCPIKPGDSFLYNWTATQYGSSWYHSHYSIQYADGLVGPLTIHGPTSAPFDEPADKPLLVTDWGHNSGFEAIYLGPRGLANPSILLNGAGNITRYAGVPSKDAKPRYTLTFQNQTSPRPKRYLLRVINTSYESIFVFSIDNHYLTVVSADFVPIHPYSNTSILVGVGQRYNVIVEAKPELNLAGPIPTDGNFWIRTYVAFCDRSPPTNDCSQLNGHPAGYEKNGILRYNPSSESEPTSQPWPRMSCACSDETYTSLRPVVPWYVGSAANKGQEFDLTLNLTGGTPKFPLAKFALEVPGPAFFNPLQIDYGKPTFLYLNKTSDWNPQLVVIPEDFTDNDWVFFIIAGDRTDPKRATIGAHPIHLHGHDFALLQQVEGQPFSMDIFKPNLINPPRRDVVLLPRNGFVAIAFRTDNPGAWLLHCHIARHASEGLALQILERRSDANVIWPFDTSPAIGRARDLCDRWDVWQKNCSNWWHPKNANACPNIFQDDSGI